jgi:uncharacterized DUF497 family protein
MVAMLVIWDEQKSILNGQKHGIRFETAQRVFDDPDHLSMQDRHVKGEERWQTLGLIEGVVIVLVAHTVHESEDNEEIIRIISARKATKYEREAYEQNR